MAYDKTVFPHIYNFMEKNSTSNFTWQEVGIHYATLNSLVNRGYLDKKNGSYTITPKGRTFAKIEAKTKGYDYFCLRKKDRTLGMMCYVKGADVFDAFDRKYDLDVDGIMLSFHKPNSEEVPIS